MCLSMCHQNTSAELFKSLMTDVCMINNINGFFGIKIDGYLLHLNGKFTNNKFIHLTGKHEKINFYFISYDGFFFLHKLFVKRRQHPKQKRNFQSPTVLPLKENISLKDCLLSTLK